MSLYERMKNRKEQSEQDNERQDQVRLINKIRSNYLSSFTAAAKDRKLSDQELAQEVQKILETALVEESKFLPKEDKDALLEQIIQDIIGLGPIQPLLEDQEISEIMINGPSQIIVERKGKLELTTFRFINNEHVTNTIEKIISPLGRRLDESSPMVDARLPDGSRINAIIPPLALNGPTVTIRKFKKEILTINHLIQFGSLNKDMSAFLEYSIKSRKNILIVGGTGSGKTTLLNVLSSFIPEDERIITIEDAAELKLSQPHIVSLETRPPNIEGKGEVTIRDLIKNSLRMRPDRIIVGEVRGAEALDMLQAMNTGHSGSLSTIHANTPRDALSRLETLVLMSGYDLPLRAIRDQIASAIDILVQIRRFPDGSRKITNISKIDGAEHDTITIGDIFEFEEKMHFNNSSAIKGIFKQVGILPQYN